MATGEAPIAGEHADWYRYHDPVLRLARTLAAEGTDAVGRIHFYDAEIREDMKRAMQEALESPFPEPQTALDDVYAGSRVMTNTATFAAAFVEALHDGLSADPRASIVGGYVLGLGPERQLMDRIRQDFPDRVIDPPTSEAAIAALGTGAAMAGAHPFVDLGTASFSYLAWSQLANEAAVAHYMTGGRLNVPVTFHFLHGVRGAGAAQHSHSPHAMLTNVPGLEIVAPSMPADAYGLVRAAMASPNPTLVVNHARLLGIEGPLPDDRAPLPLGRADIKRRGRDVTILAVSLMVHYALAAAERLARDGIDVEVIDPRSLAPFDEATLLAIRGQDRTARGGRRGAADRRARFVHRRPGRRARLLVAQGADCARRPRRYAGAVQPAAGEIRHARRGKDRSRRAAHAGGTTAVTAAVMA